MQRPPVVYIAGERQHAGKTVASLGIVSALCSHLDPADIGYFKPVGQEMVELPGGEKIDKDVRIVREFAGLAMPDLAMLSPVRVVSGVTREFLRSDDPRALTAKFEQAIQRAMEQLARKKLVIAEGTGHPGVGSAVGLSNARVANLLGARILYLVGGGIGRTLDELEVDLSYFSHHRCRMAGVLFNKLIPGKVAMMREVLTEKALARLFPEWDPPLGVFGYMPQVEYLNNPSMHLVGRSFAAARVLRSRCGGAWHLPCRKVKIISQGSDTFEPGGNLRARDIAVIGAGSHRRTRRILDFNAAMPGEKLGGLVFTCATDRMPDAQVEGWLAGSGLPAIAVPNDTADTDLVLHQCFASTKLQLYDRLKHRSIVDLFAEHFDTRRFIRALGL